MDVPERRQWRGSDFAAGKKVPSECRRACVLQEDLLLRTGALHISEAFRIHVTGT